MKVKFRSELLRLAMPIAFQQFMVALVSACDALMLVGVNQDSLSAVSLASQITFVFNLILTALTIGENMFVAQYYGKKDYRGVRVSATLVLQYVLLTSVVFLLATFFIPEILMHLFTGDAVLIVLGGRYLRWIGLSYVFSGILQVLQGLLKNCGYVGKSTIISAIVVSANSVANITKNLLICVCTGVGCGGSIMIGNLLGEGKLKEARETGNLLCRVALFSGLLTGGVILLLIPGILYFINLTDTALEYLRGMLFICSYYVIGKSINSMTIGGIFPAGGDTKFGLKCDAITMWCFAVPVGCIAAFVWKAPVLVVYFMLNLDEIVKLPAVFGHYKKYTWVKNLIEEED